MIMTRYGPELAKELESEGIIEAPSGGLSLQNLDTRKLWTRRVNDIVEVPYTFTNQFSSSHRATIDSALKSLGDSAKVIKFVRRTSQSDYVLIRSGTGCSSFIGKQGGKQDMSIKIASCFRKGTIQHEFMHAIGILHEQSRPDRDNFVTINTQNIKAGREFNFRRADGTKLLGNPYDYKSVMHYPKGAFSRNGRDTITTKNGASIGQREGADFQDILDIRLMYQCTSGPRTLSQYNSNRCTSSCKCWKDEVGCNGNNNACQGSLVCSSNKCVNPGSGPTPPTPTPPTPTPPAPTPTPPTSTGGFSKKFVLINPQTGKALDVNSGSCNDRTNIHLWGRNNSGAQVFHYHYATKAIVNVKCNKAIDVNAAHCSDGTNIQLYTRNQTGAQQFTFYEDGTIRNDRCGKAIDIYQKDTASGTNIWLYTVDNAWDKKWKIVYV